MYNLEGPGTKAFFRNWMSSAFMVPEMLENFAKLAFIEGSQPTEKPTLVHVDLLQYPNALECPFIIPQGWQVAGAYTNIDSGAPQKLLHPSYSVPLSLTPSSSIYLDNHSTLSAISLSSSSVNFLSWEGSFQDLLSPKNITDITITNHDACKLRFELVLHMHTFEPPAAAIVDIPLGDFIDCDLQVFNKGIKYYSNFFRSFFPAVWVIILDTCTKMKNMMHIELGTAKSCTSFNSCAIAFLTKLEMLLVGMGQPIEKGLKVLLLVTQERQLYIHSMKEHAIGLVDDPKKSSFGGLALKDKATMPEELRAHITAILGIQSYNKEVESVDFTRHKKTRKPFRCSIILSMITNHLIQPDKGSNTPIIDLFPKLYTVIPIKLISSACAYVVCALHASFPDSSEAFHPNMIIKEEHSQMQLLKCFCESSSAKVVKFNQWLSTRDGTDG
ncbi:hypothetical protein V8B97DRAFT_2026897 [Scleroderma yunnanense]